MPTYDFSQFTCKTYTAIISRHPIGEGYNARIIPSHNGVTVDALIDQLRSLDVFTLVLSWHNTIPLDVIEQIETGVFF